MALQPIVSAYDGPRVTVNSLVKQPTVIPMRIIALMENQFIADSVLRNGGSIPGGVAEFFESTPLFANQGSAIREEFGEYRIVQTSMGVPSIATSVNRGLAILVSEEMRRRNQMDRVNIQMTQVKNTLIRDWDLAFQTGFVNNASIPTVAATALWTPGTANTNPRHDILKAQQTVSEAVDPDQTNNYFGFKADTMVMSTTDSFHLLENLSFNNVYQWNLASENLLYTGKLPNQIYDLDVLVSRTWPQGKVMVCERNTVGFICDERPLQSTPLYENLDNETWRSNTSRVSAMGVDQPYAACIITGV